MLVNVLIIFFLFLILYQIFLASFNFFEGLENNCNTNDPVILSQKNAGEIELLKSRVNELSNPAYKKEIYDISLNVTQLNSQVLELVNQQAQAANSLVGTSPPEISGTTEPIS